MRMPLLLDHADAATPRSCGCRYSSRPDCGPPAGARARERPEGAKTILLATIAALRARTATVLPSPAEAAKVRLAAAPASPRWSPAIRIRSNSSSQCMQQRTLNPRWRAPVRCIQRPQCQFRRCLAADHGAERDPTRGKTFLQNDRSRSRRSFGQAGASTSISQPWATASTAGAWRTTR
jgi:hypothetical protein